MFFTVKKSIRIADKVYSPCICYDLPKFLEATIQKLEKEGKAVIHNEMVFFQNGKIIEKKEAVKKNLTTEKPKKEKKIKAVPVADVQELAETAEIVPIEEIKDDESEGF